MTNNFVSFILAIVLTIASLSFPQLSEARSSKGYSKGYSSKSYKPKTVRVRSYSKKNGTIVRSHMRSAPKN